MTIAEFCEEVAALGKARNGSVTSWGRSTKHSVAVGGFAGDPHTLWLGVDMIYDTGPNWQNHPPSPTHCTSCSLVPLIMVIHEKTHDHYQPMDLSRKTP